MKVKPACKLDRESYTVHLCLQECRDFFQGELAQFKPHCQPDADEILNGFDELIEIRTCQLEAEEAVNSIGEGERAQNSTQIYSKFCCDSHNKANSVIGRAHWERYPVIISLIANKMLMSCIVHSGVLSRWIPRLPQLKHLNTSNVAPTKDNGTLIQLHCPSFKGLHLPEYYGFVLLYFPQ